MAAPTYTWTNVVASDRPFQLLDPNLRLYDNTFASASVNWSATTQLQTAPVVTVTGGQFVATSNVTGFAVYRSTNSAHALPAPCISVETVVDSMNLGGRNVRTFAGPAIVASDGSYLFIYYDAKNGTVTLSRKQGGTVTDIQTTSLSLVAPFTLTLTVTGRVCIGHATDSASVNTFTLAQAHGITNFEQPAVYGGYRPGWMAGSYDADGSTAANAVVKIGEVRSAMWGGVSVREMYPVARKRDGGMVTDESGRILCTATNPGVAFSSSAKGTAHWGLFWYNPATYTLSDCITRIYSDRDSQTLGDSDGQIVYDDVLGQWHVYVVTTSGYSATPTFDIRYARYDSDLRTAGVVRLAVTAVTLPAAVTSTLLYDPNIRFINGEWWIWFSENNGSVFWPVLAKGSTPSNFGTLVARITGATGFEGTKFAMLNRTWYALAVGTSNNARAYDLAGTNQGSAGIPSLPANAAYHPHPAIFTHQYVEGGVRKRRYHRVTFTDSNVTTDGLNWLPSDWQFGAMYVDVSEALTGWDANEGGRVLESRILRSA